MCRTQILPFEAGCGHCRSGRYTTNRTQPAVLASWFTGTVQKVDRKSGANLGIWHDFAAPHDAIELPGGQVIVAELGAGQLTLADGDTPENRTVIARGLAGPLGLALAGDNAVYLSETAGILSRIDIDTGDKTVIAEGLALPEGLYQNRMAQWNGANRMARSNGEILERQ